MTALTYGALPVAIDPTAWTGRSYSPSEPQDAGSIQAAIAAQLSEHLSGAGLAIPVYVFPDFDLDTWWQSSAIAFVLVSYHGARFGKPMTTDAMVQERTLSFDVHVEARQTAWALSGAGSVYALVDAVEAALTGYRPPSCRNAYFAEERFAEQDAEGRVWLYDMRLEVPTLKLKTEPAMALANLVRAQMYVAALALANGAPVSAGSYAFAGGVLTLPGPYPVVVGAVSNAAGTVLYREFVDWECDGATGVVTAIAAGGIGASDTVAIACAPADTVVATE
ncbi:MAG: Gp37 family protein [Acetobacteraceae bacterium]